MVYHYHFVANEVVGQYSLGKSGGGGGGGGSIGGSIGGSGG